MIATPLPIDDPEVVPFVQHDGDVDGWCASRSHSDLGNAARLRARFGEHLLYVRHHGWHAWSGSHWDRAGGADKAQLLTHKTAAAIRREAPRSRRPTPIARRPWSATLSGRECPAPYRRC